MALNKSQKQELIDLYSEGLAQAPHAFILGFQGISVPDVTELRSKVRESGGQYQVVKNTLALRAIQGQPIEEHKDTFKGATAVAYSDDDAVALAKALTEFAKGAPMIEFKGGVVGGKAVAPDQIKDIADLPSREELIAKLLFLLQSPVTRLVRDLAALTRQFVVVLDQVALKKGE